MSDQAPAIAKLILWRDAEYDRRTRAVEEGTASIDWLVPEYRISFTECRAKADELGVVMDAIDLRHVLAASWKARKKENNK